MDEVMENLERAAEAVELLKVEMESLRRVNAELSRECMELYHQREELKEENSRLRRVMRVQSEQLKAYAEQMPLEVIA